MVKELTLEEYELSYQRYLANSIENYEMIDNMYGSLTESGDISLNEGFVDALKGFVQKIMDAISKVWEKFVRAVENLFTNNNRWLTKYKNIILNKKPMNATLNDYYEYNIEKIKSVDIPKLNDPMNLDLDTKEKFIDATQQFKEMMKDSKKSFSDNVKAAFRGGDAKSIQASELKMEDMYNYCMNYNKEIKDKIYQSIDNLKDANKKAFRIIDKMARGAKSTFKAKDNVTPNNTNDNKDQGNDQNKTDGNANNNEQKQEAFTYADTMAYYFNEMDIQDDNKDDNNQQQQSGNDSNQNTSNQQDGNGEKTDEQSKKSEECIKAYFNACSEFLGAKLNIANEAYKTFIKIMKWHVKNYDKNADLGGDNNSANGENKQGENNTGNGDQQKGQEAQHNSTSLSDSEEVTSFSENYLEEASVIENEELKRKYISAFYKWYQHPSLGFSYDTSTGVDHNSLIVLLKMIPDKNKLSHIVTAGRAKRLSNELKNSVEDIQKYGDYYFLFWADEAYYAISPDKSKFVCISYGWKDSAHKKWGVKVENAYSTVTEIPSQCPTKSEVSRICKAYGMVKEAELFGITLNEASYEDRFDSSFLEAVTSNFGTVGDDDPFKGLSFM